MTERLHADHPAEQPARAVPIARDPWAAPFVVVPIRTLGERRRHQRLIARAAARPHVYVETDVPPGMTLDEYRRGGA